MLYPFLKLFIIEPAMDWWMGLQMLFYDGKILKIPLFFACFYNLLFCIDFLGEFEGEGGQRLELFLCPDNKDVLHHFFLSLGKILDFLFYIAYFGDCNPVCQVRWIDYYIYIIFFLVASFCFTKVELKKNSVLQLFADFVVPVDSSTSVPKRPMCPKVVYFILTPL